jgi:hypothetical protein
MGDIKFCRNCGGKFELSGESECFACQFGSRKQVAIPVIVPKNRSGRRANAKRVEKKNAEQKRAELNSIYSQAQK